jgi:hypothetical protein
MANGHGGARPGAGRKRKPLADALAEGVRPSRLRTINFANAALSPDATLSMPEAREYLNEAQLDGDALMADEFYKGIWDWLAERKCEKLFDPDYLQRFAMQQARYVQLERLLSRRGFLVRPPVGGEAANPLFAMRIEQLKVLNQMQAVIDAVVKENCTERFTNMRSNDPMERLLQGG